MPNDRHVGEFFGQLGESLGRFLPAEVRQRLHGRFEALGPGGPLRSRPQRRIVLQDQGEPAGPIQAQEPFRRRGIVVGQEHLRVQEGPGGVPLALVQQAVGDDPHGLVDAVFHGAAAGGQGLLESARWPPRAGRHGRRGWPIRPGPRDCRETLEESGGIGRGRLDLAAAPQQHPLDRQQARPRGAGRQQLLDVLQAGRRLVGVQQPVDLLQLVEEIGAAELDLLAGATRAERIGVDGHSNRGQGPGDRGRDQGPGIRGEPFSVRRQWMPVP